MRSDGGGGGPNLGPDWAWAIAIVKVRMRAYAAARSFFFIRICLPDDSFLVMTCVCARELWRGYLSRKEFLTNGSRLD
jgi:hypothetical protein